MKHSHYYKTMPCLNVDVYRVLLAFEVTDPCIQHSIKKLLVAGGRGAKDAKKDVEEAIDSLVRWLEMRREEEAQPEPPHLQAGDQIAWNAGDGWQYVTLKESDLPNMHGNDLKVSICDTMNLADAFLRDIRASELAYAENQHKTLWTEADEERMRVVLSNGNDGEVYKQDDDWVEWKGGECPVCGFQWVDVQVRSGDTYSGRAEVFVWGWNADEADIVAYRNIPRKCA